MAPGGPNGPGGHQKGLKSDLQTAPGKVLFCFLENKKLAKICSSEAADPLTTLGDIFLHHKYGRLASPGTALVPGRGDSPVLLDQDGQAVGPACSRVKAGQTGGCGLSPSSGRRDPRVVHLLSCRHLWKAFESRVALIGSIPPSRGRQSLAPFAQPQSPSQWAPGRQGEVRARCQACAPSALSWIGVRQEL